MFFLKAQVGLLFFVVGVSVWLGVCVLVLVGVGCLWRKVYIVVVWTVFWWNDLESGVEVKKVDAQGRLILPADWREAEVGESRELYVVKRKGYLKIVPKRRVDLTERFDGVDLGVEAIGGWKQFEKRFCEAGV